MLSAGWHSTAKKTKGICLQISYLGTVFELIAFLILFMKQTPDKKPDAMLMISPVLTETWIICSTYRPVMNVDQCLVNSFVMESFSRDDTNTTLQHESN